MSSAEEDYIKGFSRYAAMKVCLHVAEKVCSVLNEESYKFSPGSKEGIQCLLCTHRANHYNWEGCFQSEG